MKRRGLNKVALAAGVVLVVGIGAAALAWGLGVWPFAESDAGPAIDPGPLPVKTRLAEMGPRHAAADVVLAHALTRLHQEALHHFYSDPHLGMRRMPPVYEKVVKEWSMPYFSPGELDEAEPIPFKAEMERIHAASVADFLDPKPALDVTPRAFGIRRLDDKSGFDKARKFFEAKSVDLIGLVLHDEPVAYISEKVPEVKKGGKAPMRPLDEFEVVGLEKLQKGEQLFGSSRHGVIRLLGAVRASDACLACHEDKKEGDLLGAFSYTLREAEYRTTFGRFDGRPK